MDRQVDRELVLTKGREAAGKLLVELQVRKSTADAAGAREYYTKLTQPAAGWDGEIRNLVLQKKLVSNLCPYIKPICMLHKCFIYSFLPIMGIGAIT